MAWNIELAQSKVTHISEVTCASRRLLSPAKRLFVCLVLRYRVSHICVSENDIIGSDNGLWSVRPQAIVWTNARLLSIASLLTNFRQTGIKCSNFHPRNGLNIVHIALNMLYMPAKWFINRLAYGTQMLPVKLVLEYGLLNWLHHSSLTSTSFSEASKQYLPIKYWLFIYRIRASS